MKRIRVSLVSPMTKVVAVFIAVLISSSSQSQTQAPPTEKQQSASGKPRVFITDSQSWEMIGGAAGTSDGFAGGTSGGARPQTAEIMKTFGERCPACTITMKKERADFIVILEHEGGKKLGQRDNKVVVFSKDGDSIYSGSTRSLGNSVKDACEAIAKYVVNEPIQTPPNVSPTVVKPATVSISSSVTGAEIDVDGAFVGNTPASLQISPGLHKISVKSGGQIWERSVQVFEGSSINLVAAFERAGAAGPSLPTTTPTATEKVKPSTSVAQVAAAASIPPASPIATQQPQVSSSRTPPEEVVKSAPEPPAPQPISTQSIRIVCPEKVSEVPFSSSRPDRTKLACGEAITIVSESPNWIRVKTPDGVEGNVAARFVAK